MIRQNKVCHDIDIINLAPPVRNKEARKGLFSYAIIWFGGQEIPGLQGLVLGLSGQSVHQREMAGSIYGPAFVISEDTFSIGHADYRQGSLPCQLQIS